MNLLPTLLFVLVVSYILLVGLKNAQFSLVVGGETVRFHYQGLRVPVDYGKIKTAVVFLFGAIVIGLPMPLLSERRAIKAAVALFQVGAFVYGLYIFVMAIINLAQQLS